jgi:hypothetical protein
MNECEVEQIYHLHIHGFAKANEKLVGGSN